ncbi:hypothetical protein BC829DRAFT_264430 [Chytridium lagenaria]|nr:hypothetical protein BC829DRAFT_264430 [Chytridium lagenaria]
MSPSPHPKARPSQSNPQPLHPSLNFAVQSSHPIPSHSPTKHRSVLFAGHSKTTPNTDVTWNAPFLGIRLVANTKAAANITFGTGVRLAPNQFPPDLNRTLQFAGLIDYGAFYIHVTPPTVGINSFTLTTPELSYEQSMSIVSPSQITGWLVDTSTLFYVTSIQSPVPRLRTILYTPGTFVFLAGASGSNAGNSNFGVNSFLGLGVSRLIHLGGARMGA